MTVESGQRSDRSAPAPATLKPLQTILQQEMAEAESELARPALGLLLSGLLAGIGVGFSALLIAALMTRLGDDPAVALREFLIGNAYSVGFILVILARTDLFTEYTTIAILPVLDGRSPLSRLGRLWVLVYLGNLVGTAAIAGVVVLIGPGLGIIEPWAFTRIALRIVEHPWSVVLTSGFLAGWLMGLLSWLVVSARETISQIFLIWLVTFVIGFTHLHHSVTGSAEVLVGLFTSTEVSLLNYAHFLIWATIGNAAGGVVFALLIRYSALLGGSRDTSETGVRNRQGRS